MVKWHFHPFLGNFQNKNRYEVDKRLGFFFFLLSLSCCSAGWKNELREVKYKYERLL